MVRRSSTGLPPPLWGRDGVGGGPGSHRGATLTTPTPIPSPQGGGEEFAAAANRISAPVDMTRPPRSFLPQQTGESDMTQTGAIRLLNAATVAGDGPAINMEFPQL